MMNVVDALGAGLGASTSSYEAVNLFIKNLDPSIDDQRLHQEFSPFGRITNAKVMMPGGRSKGVAFVHYSSPLEAQRAASAMNGRTLDANRIHVALNEKKGAQKTSQRTSHIMNLVSAFAQPRQAGIYHPNYFQGQQRTPKPAAQAKPKATPARHGSRQASCSSQGSNSYQQARGNKPHNGGRFVQQTPVNKHPQGGHMVNMTPSTARKQHASGNMTSRAIGNGKQSTGSKQSGHRHQAPGHRQHSSGCGLWGGLQASGGGQRALGGGQRASGGGQRASGGGQRSSGGGQRSSGGGQRSSGGGQRSSGGGQRSSGGGKCSSGGGNRASGGGHKR